MKAALIVLGFAALGAYSIAQRSRYRRLCREIGAHYMEELLS